LVRRPAGRAVARGRHETHAVLAAAKQNVDEPGLTGLEQRHCLSQPRLKEIEAGVATAIAIEHGGRGPDLARQAEGTRQQGQDQRQDHQGNQHLDQREALLAGSLAAGGKLDHFGNATLRVLSCRERLRRVTSSRQLTSTATQ
jgi:hypothetical protein